MPDSLNMESEHVDESDAARSPRPDRRRRLRGGPQGEPSRSHLVARVLGTYVEMPGLTLRLDHAARLFGLREVTCLGVLSDLVRDGRLRQTPDGQYRALTSGV
jgi:hypothetical protein